MRAKPKTRTTRVFDVMCGDRFIMQYHCDKSMVFPLDQDRMLEEIFSMRPSLKGMDISLFETNSIV